MSWTTSHHSFNCKISLAVFSSLLQHLLQSALYQCVCVCLSYCMQKHCVLLETYKIDKDPLSHGVYFWVGNSVGSRNRQGPVCLEQSKRMGRVTGDIKEESGAPSCRTFLVIWGLRLSSQWNGEALQGFEQRSGKIWFMSSKIHSGFSVRINCSGSRVEEERPVTRLLQSLVAKTRL